jgi:hypothetical protein
MSSADRDLPSVGGFRISDSDAIFFREVASDSRFTLIPQWFSIRSVSRVFLDPQVSRSAVFLDPQVSRSASF